MKDTTPMLKPAVAPCFSNSSQSWHYTSHWHAVTRDVMLRVSIRRNAYDEQSFARVEAFDKTKNEWNTIGSVPFTSTACQEVSYVMRSLTPGQKALFERDAKRLLDLAMVIIQEPGAPKMPLAA
jgi:hypothetical protein